MRRSVLGGIALCLALTAAGCGGDTDAGPGTETTAAAPSSSPADPETSTSPDDESPSVEGSNDASGDTYASSEPAAGQQLTTDAGALSAPADWPQNPLDETTGYLVGPTPAYGISLSDLTASDDAATTDELATEAIEFASFTDAVQRLDDVTIVDTPAYHLFGPDEVFTDSVVDEFGLTAGGRDFTIRVTTPKDLAQAERDQVVGTVVASFQLTGA